MQSPVDCQRSDVHRQAQDLLSTSLGTHEGAIEYLLCIYSLLQN